VSASGFDAASLDRRYAYLDACPQELFEDVVTLPVGELPERVRWVRRWVDALSRGRLPADDSWPSPAITQPIREALESMGLARFCRDQPDLVTAVMKDVLRSFRKQAAVLREDVHRRLRELEELERLRLEQEEAARARKAKRKPSQVRLDDDALARLRQQAKRDAESLERDADPDLITTWDERARAWAAIADVFGDLGELMGRGWDLARGVLRHAGWIDLMRLRELVETVPQLRDIVRTLGRLQDSSSDTSVAERLFVPVMRIEEERLEIRTPYVPAETRGIERSGDIARMLPSEAMMLGHPELKLLWHARRAERALLTYRVEGIEIERHRVEREALEETEGQRPRPERGPIIAVLDTSGSMHGLPEQVAKALVLEAVRTAHAENRRCFLFAYSGPGDLIEHELDISSEGLGRLLEFLGFSFGGGTDVVGPMNRVLETLRHNDWKKADVMWVSDGEFPVPTQLSRAVGDARDEGTRFHGVRVGSRGGTGLHALCEPVHEFTDWLDVVR